MHLHPITPGETGRLILTDSQAELFRALFLTLREWYPHRLARHLEGPPDEPLMAKGVLTPDEDEWWKGTEAATIIGVMMDELHDQAPEGCFFGPLEQGTNDYGYWPTPPEHAACPNPRWRHVGMNPDYVPPTRMTADEAYRRIVQHLLKGGGIYATENRECSRFYKVRVVSGHLELWDGFSWFRMTRPVAFNNGEGSAGELFTYE